jgi:hypothetical protein
MTKRSRNGSRSSKKSSGSRYKTPGAKVQVTWEDAYSENSWARDPLRHEPVIVQNLGHVLFHDKRGIMIAASRTNDDTAGSRFFIPSGMIRKIEVLR